MNLIKMVVTSLPLIFLTGCQFGAATTQQPPIVPELEILALDKSAEEAIHQITTTEKKMALTFNGLADENTMNQLLDELDRFGIQATFFLPGMRVAEDPVLAKEVLNRGHSIQNNTLNHVLPDHLTYEEAYVEISLANKVFYEHLNIETNYVRSRSGDSSEVFEQAATQLGMQVVTSTIKPRDRFMQNAEEIAAYVKRFATRGAIIELNTYINPAIIPAIELIAKDADSSGYTLTTMEEVREGQYITDNQPSTNRLMIQENYEQAEPEIIRRFSTKEKEIALTFDDWASDETISAVLEILDAYQVQATFFLIGSGVERNPQLAKLIAEHGHDIGSHSFSHQVITTMDPLELQEDLVKNDGILAYALQEKPLNYFRPAQGVIDEQTAKVVAATGVEYIVLYDVASFDWNMMLTEEEVFNRIKERTRPGSIIGMHILDDSHVVSVLPRVIEHYQQAGYVFKKISEMIKTEEEAVNLS